jgi:hypothetical protein
LEIYWNRRKSLPVNSCQETEAGAHSLKGPPGTLSEELTHVRLERISATSGITQRESVFELADCLARKLHTLRPEEATAARVLRERVKNQRMG